MADLFAYLDWRGDLPFSQVPVTPVDALLFSALSYIDFDGVVPRSHTAAISLADAAARLTALPDRDDRVRTKHDLPLLQKMAQCPRFAQVGLTGFDSQLIPEEETQFAALTFLSSPTKGKPFGIPPEMRKNPGTQPRIFPFLARKTPTT